MRYIDKPNLHMKNTHASSTILLLGFGFPSAEHFKVNSAGAVMVWSSEKILLAEAGQIKCLNAQRLPNTVRLKTGST